jgi:hypothetical protein
MPDGHAGVSALLEATTGLPRRQRARLLGALAGWRQLDPALWRDLGPAVVAYVDDEAPADDTVELVRVAASLPLDPADRPAGWPQTAAPDFTTVPARIASLRSRLEANPAGPAAAVLAILPIEDHQVPAQAFDAAFAEGSDDVRLWAAIAEARLGAFAALDTVLADLAAGQHIPDFLSGDPHSAYDRLALARPVPEPLRRHLLGSVVGKPVSDLVVWALTGTHPAAPGAAANSPDMRRAAEYLLSAQALQSPPWAQDSDPRWLAAVDHDTAGAVATNLIELRRRTAPSRSAGNRFFALVAALPAGYRLAAGEVLASYLHDPGALAFEEFAFALSRADTDDVLTGFATHLTPDGDGPRRVAILDLLGEVAEMSHESDAPMAAAGLRPTTRDVDVEAMEEAVADLIPWDRPIGREGPLLRPGRFREHDIAFLTGEDHGDDLLATDGLGTALDTTDDAQPGGDVPIDTAADTAPDPPTPAQPPCASRPPRVVRADVFLPRDHGPAIPLSHAFMRGRTHRVEVWIGHDRDAGPDTVTADQEFPEGAVVPDPGRFTELQVTLAYAGQAQTKTLALSNDAGMSSAPCLFDVTVAAEQAEVRALITVGQLTRTLQQFVLTGPTVAAGADPTAEEDRIELSAEVMARPTDAPAAASAFDVSINRSTAADSCVLIDDGDPRVVPLWDDGLRATVDAIADRLYTAAQAVAVDQAGTVWPALIRFLAAKGTQLHTWLQTRGYETLDSAQRIQLVDADPTRPLPLEIVYTGPRLAKHATPCPQWDQALETGQCAACAAAPKDYESLTICPLNFWGLTKVIERQTGTTATRPDRLHPLGSVLFASSDQVFDDDYNAVVDVLTETAQTPPATATEWNQWPGLIAEHKPTLIVVLPHQDRDPDLDVDYLEIGDDSQLRSGDLSPDQLRCADGPAPVVLLLGCNTAKASVTYLNFVAEFRTKGAPIVLGTLATVLGRDAAAIAGEFVRELAAARTTGGHATTIRLGEVMRTVRRRMVAKNNAAALGLIAFGDSDWQMEVGA